MNGSTLALQWTDDQTVGDLFERHVPAVAEHRPASLCLAVNERCSQLVPLERRQPQCSAAHAGRYAPLFQIYTDYSDAKQFAERAIYQHTGKSTTVQSALSAQRVLCALRFRSNKSISGTSRLCGLTGGTIVGCGRARALGLH